jgi:hypothetical protein
MICGRHGGCLYTLLRLQYLAKSIFRVVQFRQYTRFLHITIPDSRSNPNQKRKQALSVRKFVLETAKYNMLTARSTREAVDIFHMFPNDEESQLP